MTECWLVCPNVTKGKKLHCAVMHVTFLSQNGLVLDHPLPIGRIVNGQYYCAFLQCKVRPVVHCKQPEQLEYGVSLLQNNATPHHHCDVQNMVRSWGWGVGTFSLLFRFCIDYWFAHVKEIFGVNDLNQMMMRTLLSMLFTLSVQEWTQRCNWSFNT